MAVNTATTSRASNASYTTHNVTSKDGTIIGYHQLGQGAGVVLIQGSMGTAQHFMELADLLARALPEHDPGAGPAHYQKALEFAHQAPVMIVLISSPIHGH